MKGWNLPTYFLFLCYGIVISGITPNQSLLGLLLSFPLPYFEHEIIITVWNQGLSTQIESIAGFWIIPLRAMNLKTSDWF